MSDFSPADTENVSLCEALDRVLNKGAVLIGEIRISVANVDLIYLGLQLVLTSIETAREVIEPDGNREKRVTQPSDSTIEIRG
jgi:hypothetical protein